MGVQRLGVRWKEDQSYTVSRKQSSLYQMRTDVHKKLQVSRRIPYYNIYIKNVTITVFTMYISSRTGGLWRGLDLIVLL